MAGFMAGVGAGTTASGMAPVSSGGAVACAGGWTAGGWVAASAAGGSGAGVTPAAGGTGAVGPPAAPAPAVDAWWSRAAASATSWVQTQRKAQRAERELNES